MGKLVRKFISKILGLKSPSKGEYMLAIHIRSFNKKYHNR
jgi:hypothetical protein